MRFDERTLRPLAAGLLCLAAAGCSSIGEPMAKLREAAGMAPAPAASASAATASVAAGASVKPAADTRPAVSEPTQRAFDDARRLLAAGKTADAEKAFRALSASQPELAGAHANLGLILRQAGKLDEAVAELERAVSLSPQQPIYWNQLGLAYRQQGQFTKARTAYEKAVTIDPGYAAAQLNLGILHDLYLGDAPHALEQYTRYLALSPAGDATVGKWVTDLKNRKPAPAQQQALSSPKKEQP